MSKQVSQLFRRGVVRPIDANGKSDLEQFYVGESSRFEWLPILDEHHFASIWESGLLQGIGKACNVRMTDYEEILIEPHEVANAINAVREFLARPAQAFGSSLLALLLDAQRSGMPVLFVL